MYSTLFTTALLALTGLLSVSAPATASPVLESRALTTFTGRILVRNAANGTNYGYFAKSSASDDAKNSTPTALYSVTNDVSAAATFTFNAAASGVTDNITITYLTGLSSVPRRTVVSTTLIAQSVLPSEANKRTPQYIPNAFEYTASNKNLKVFYIRGNDSSRQPLTSVYYRSSNFVLRPTSASAQGDSTAIVVNVFEPTA